MRGSWVIPWVSPVAAVDLHCRGWNWSAPSLLQKIAGRRRRGCTKEKERYDYPLWKRLSFTWVAEVYYLEELRTCLAFIRDNLIWFKYMSTATHCYYYPLSLGDVVPHPGSSCLLCIILWNYCYMQNCNLDQWDFTDSLKFFLPGDLVQFVRLWPPSVPRPPWYSMTRILRRLGTYLLEKIRTAVDIIHRKLCRPLGAHPWVPESPSTTDVNRREQM